MKLCIVDDEKVCYEKLNELLQEYTSERGIDVEIDWFSDSASFLAAFSPDVYSLIFLDIFIDDMSGLDIAKKIREQSERAMLVFCTTSLDSMAGAFSSHAFDYIVKPATKERITKLMDDALKVLPRMKRVLTFTSNRQTVKVFFSECLFVTANGHYLEITDTTGTTYKARLTAKEFLDMTEGDDRFMIINKGIVVNMDHIVSIEERTCTMSDGTTFPIRVRDSAKISQDWQDYCFAQIRDAHS